jgi:HEAT repeat protein
VRRAAIQLLGALRDKSLSSRFIEAIKSDESYLVVAEAALAPGEAPEAFDALVALLAQDSWQERLRAGAMRGLLELKDPRAIGVALEWAPVGQT